jgi:hypothetical protein
MSVNRIIRREAILLIIMTLVGVLILPLCVFLVGKFVFGEYAGAGFGEFYRDIHSDLRSGEPDIVFLLFSPYIIWQLIRLSFGVFFRMSPKNPKTNQTRKTAADDV